MEPKLDTTDRELINKLRTHVEEVNKLKAMLTDRGFSVELRAGQRIAGEVSANRSINEPI